MGGGASDFPHLRLPTPAPNARRIAILSAGGVGRGVPCDQIQNNPQHVRVLANEMFATRLGVTLGLPMPSVKVIEVCNWLITHTRICTSSWLAKSSTVRAEDNWASSTAAVMVRGLQPIICMASYSRVFAIWRISPDCWFSLLSEGLKGQTIFRHIHRSGLLLQRRGMDLYGFPASRGLREQLCL